MARWKSLGVVFVVLASCGRSTLPPPPKHLPATAAGTSSASGPGVPVGFSGNVTHSIELTDEERTAIERANALASARDPDVEIRTALTEVNP